MGIATVITSGKGGVGKSTVTVGLGRALAGRGRRVLLIDCDAGLRSLDRLTGTEESLVYDISDVVYGRCSPAEAIYSCNQDGLFLLPAAASVDDRIPPAVMGRLAPLLKRYYDHVLLDSPAGVGSGFQSAACAADQALVLCSPDPVCARSTASVRGLLEDMGLRDARLVINLLDLKLFWETNAFYDLDSVVDACGLRLMGVIPKDGKLAAAALQGKPAPMNSPGRMALERIAARLEGEAVPLPDEM